MPRTRYNQSIIGPRQTTSATSASGIFGLTDHQVLTGGGVFPRSPNSSLARLDNNFYRVSMLLSGDGTNGATNNTFRDSSSNNFTFARTGNPTQGTFSPYGNNWANYFDGSSDYLSIATNTAFSFGTGDFTIEFWIYTGDTSLTGGGYSRSLCGIGNLIFYMRINQYHGGTTGALRVTDGTSNLADGSTINLATNSWRHIALVRESGTAKLWIDGVFQTSSAYTTNLTNTNTNIIGAQTNPIEGWFNGYISNFRVVKGTAVYTGTSNFTPPTSPLTLIAGTSLLTCQSNRFRDNSTNNFAITRNGDVSVQRWSPFAPSTTYSATSVGGSGYFDGSGDYIRMSSGTVGIANTNFTICLWFYPRDASVIGLFDSGPGVVNCFRNYNFNTIEDQDTGSVSFAGNYQVNAWNWMVITKASTSFTVYINGNTIGTAACSTALAETTFTIGAINSGGAGVFNGYISDFQVLDSATVVTEPTAPLSNAAGKNLLLNFSNAGIFDIATQVNLETVGSTQINTTIVKYGTGSIAFNGSTDYLDHRTGTEVSFGIGDFTIEAWIYWVSAGSTSAIMHGNGVGWTLYVFPANRLQWGTTSPQTPANLLTGATTLVTGQWYHVAVTRLGTTVTLWLNGVSDGTVTDGANYSASGALRVGISHSNNLFNGYMDDIRITKGLARYTGTFTPPTLSHPTQ